MMDSLFSDSDLGNVLAIQEQALSNEIASLNEDRVLSTSLEELCEYFVGKYEVEPIVIDETGIQVDYGDAQVDVSHRFEYAVFNRGRPTHVTGTRITFYVPFSGDSNLFKCRPSSWSSYTPRGSVRGSDLIFVYDRPSGDAPNIGNEFKRDINSVGDYLAWSADDLEKFNSSLHQKASQQLSARREKLLSDRGIIESLGFPLKRRTGVPTTYAAPEVKRRVVPQLPPVSTVPYKPEPTLEMAEYEYILSVISSMVLVMERSPRAFKGMGEEDLRQQFLVQLNGHYEGQATGETFNYEGKTDILIRANGRNIFIAECKFWTGPSDLNDALDQLLGYTSWRDTKTALLVFNRGTTMSTVLQRIPEAVRDHPMFKTERDYGSETGFRYIFGHRDDNNRELTLTIMVFDVPA